MNEYKVTFKIGRKKLSTFVMAKNQGGGTRKARNRLKKKLGLKKDILQHIATVLSLEQKVLQLGE
jgi:hypothetical protein